MQQLDNEPKPERQGCTGECDIKHGVFESVCVTCGQVVEEVVVTPEHKG